MKCDDCGKWELELVDGWESRKALRCPGCHQYHYFVGNIHCSMTIGALPFDEEEAKRLLREAKN